MQRGMNKPIAALLLLAVLGACGDSGSADAGSPLDAAALPDAAARLDATVHPDAAAPDSGVVLDGGDFVDAEVVPDAAPIDSGAIVADGGEPADGGASPVDGGAGPATLTVSGTITGAALSRSNVIVIWRVVTSEPQRVYAFGSGTSTQAAYRITLGDVPPPDAINDDGVAVGTVAYLAAGVAPPSGVLMGLDFVNIIGLSPRHAIIYETTTAVPTFSWSSLFDPGYTCARCVRGGGAAGLDAWEPADCSAIRVELPPSRDPGDLDLCTWI